MSRKAKHQGRPLRLQHLQRRHDLAFQAKRLLVHQEQVGPEAQRRLSDDGGAHFHRLVERDVEAERLIFAVGELDHARDPDEVDPRAEIEAADDGRAGQDQDRHALEPVDERMRNGAATTQVAEAKAVVAVDQDPCVVESFHVILCLCCGDPGRPVGAGIIHDKLAASRHKRPAQDRNADMTGNGRHGATISRPAAISVPRNRRRNMMGTDA